MAGFTNNSILLFYIIALDTMFRFHIWIMSLNILLFKIKLNWSDAKASELSIQFTNQVNFQLTGCSVTLVIYVINWGSPTAWLALCEQVMHNAEWNIVRLVMKYHAAGLTLHLWQRWQKCIRLGLQSTFRRSLLYI